MTDSNGFEKTDNIGKNCTFSTSSRIWCFMRKWIGNLLALMKINSSVLGFRERLNTILYKEDSGAMGFDAYEWRYLRNVLRLRETCADNIMVPRAEVDAISLKITLADLLLFSETSVHSRLPVYKESLDDADAMIHIHDLIAYIVTASKGDSGLDLSCVDLSVCLADSGLIRPVLSVPGSVPITSLLATMQAKRIQIALIINEFGGVDGLVSIEDIIEKVFGNIEDERDVVLGLSQITKFGTSSWLVDGVAELDIVGAVTGVAFRDFVSQHADIETIGGMVSELAGRVPAKGETLCFSALPHVLFKILETDSRCIKSLSINISSANTSS